jgi:hypothetical protein
MSYFDVLIDITSSFGGIVTIKDGTKVYQKGDDCLGKFHFVLLF